MTLLIRSGGAVWTLPAFVAGRTAALASPVAAQAAAELGAVAWALHLAEEAAAEGEAA